MTAKNLSGCCHANASPWRDGYGRLVLECETCAAESATAALEYKAEAETYARRARVREARRDFIAAGILEREAAACRRREAERTRKRDGEERA